MARNHIQENENNMKSCRSGPVLKERLYKKWTKNKYLSRIMKVLNYRFKNLRDAFGVQMRVCSACVRHLHASQHSGNMGKGN